jgi:threonine dehydratase
MQLDHDELGRAAGIDVTMVVAMRAPFATTHNVAEPAGALALAGLPGERDEMAGTRVAVIQTGGNADTGLLLEGFAGRTPAA